MRSAMMLSWMSVVPPPIVSARVSSTWRAQCAPSGAPSADRRPPPAASAPRRRTSPAQLGDLLGVPHAEQLAHAAGGARLGAGQLLERHPQPQQRRCVALARPACRPAPSGGLLRPAPGRTARAARARREPNVHDCDSDTRSLASVVRATRQPPLTSPTTQSSGTNTSSRKTSLKSASPVISRSGRTSTPGERHVDQEVGDPVVPGRRRVGAGDADAPRRPAWPARSRSSGR